MIKYYHEDEFKDLPDWVFTFIFSKVKKYIIEHNEMPPYSVKLVGTCTSEECYEMYKEMWSLNERENLYAFIYDGTIDENRAVIVGLDVIDTGLC